jgi:hypothetical protein
MAGAGERQLGFLGTAPTGAADERRETLKERRD